MSGSARQSKAMPSARVTARSPASHPPNLTFVAAALAAACLDVPQDGAGDGNRTQASQRKFQLNFDAYRSRTDGV